MKHMKRLLLLMTCAIFTTFLLAFQQIPQEQAGDGPKYTTDGQLLRPEQYLKWVHVGSGLGMAYTPAGHGDSDPPFTNVYVNPSAYDSFVKTGHWPDKTMMVLEVRKALSKGSINQSGHYEGSMLAMEVHVKDEARFPGKWGFFGFAAGTKPAKMIPASADCYSCHADHGVVDTTFVQFYPTLLEIATQRGTLEPDRAASLDRPKQENPNAPSSESKPSTDGHEQETAIDPMCQMTVNVDKAAYQSVYKGKTYYFCQDSCKRHFDSEPEKYAVEERPLSRYARDNEATIVP